MITEADIEARTKAVIDEVGLDAGEVEFRSALWDAGLAFVQYPEGKGGLGVAPGMQAAVERTKFNIRHSNLSSFIQFNIFNTNSTCYIQIQHPSYKFSILHTI